MKKMYLSSVFVCILIGLCGVVFCACGVKKQYDLTVTTENSLVTCKVLVDNEELDLTDNKYVIKTYSNVTVNVYSAVYGVNFDNVKITVNGNSMSLKGGNNYNPLEYGSEKLAGYFKLPRFSANTEVSISGVAQMSSTFIFAKPETMTTEEEFKLKHTQIDVSAARDGSDWRNLYDFIYSADASYARLLSGETGTYNTHRTFLMKFDSDNMFEIGENAPFKVEFADGTVRSFTQGNYSSATKIMNMGDIGQDEEYKIIVDFAQLQCKTYNFQYEESDVYEVNVPPNCNVMNAGDDAGTIIIKLKGNDTQFSENLKCFLDGRELIGIPMGNAYTFTIPDHSIPEVGTTFVLTFENVVDVQPEEPDPILS